MGISDRMSRMMGQVQDGMKKSSISIFTIILKVFTAFAVGLTFSLVGQELMGYSTLSFIFCLFVVMAVLLKIMKTWSSGAVMIFDLFCILVGLLLRMYILLAP